MCFPIDEGGLGFRSFKDMARAFAAKLWWHFRLGESIWAKFMHAKYIKGVHPSEASVEQATGTWRRLVAVRQMAEQNIRWCLGEGLVDFWKDRWVFHEPLESVVDRSEKPHFIVSEFIARDGWDETRLARWVPGFVVQAIKEVPHDLARKDMMVWLPSPTRCFTVKLAWEVLRQRKHRSLVDSLLWPSVLPAKMSFLAWRLVRNFLPLDMTLRCRGLALPSRCGCCYLEEEALLHVFLTGPVASEVWRRVSGRFGFQLRNCSSMAQEPGALSGHAMGGWQDTSRGGLFFGIAREGRSLRGGGPLVRLPGRNRHWLLKLNSDASVNCGRASGGGLLRDSQGKLIFAFYKEFGEQDVLEAESMALLFGLQLCDQRGFCPSLVEVDSKTLVQLVGSGVIAKWPLCNILRKVRDLLEGFSALSHIFSGGKLICG
nr:uncharacterized protein LOC113693511 [Coffea arabica]